MNQLPVVVPKDLDESVHGIAPGSAIIVTRKTEDGPFDNGEPCWVVYYEGNLNGACNLETFEDKCLMAAARGIMNAPTVAWTVVKPSDFDQIGNYDYESKKLNITNEDLLSEWEHADDHVSYMKP